MTTTKAVMTLPIVILEHTQFKKLYKQHECQTQRCKNMQNIAHFIIQTITNTIISDA